MTIARPVRLALLWLALVLFLGSAYFGPQQTQQRLVPAVRTLAPWLSASGMKALHAVLRKLSHFTEYAVLALVWVRAFRYRNRLSLKLASWAALAVCVACAIVDEVHQSRVPGRQGSVQDVVLDSLGAMAAVIAVHTRRHATDTAGPDASRTGLAPVRLDEGA